MTENKRFSYMEQFNGFCDVYDCGKILSCMRLEYVENTVNLLNNLNDENKQLKILFTMYYNLFKELQRQMQGVKRMYDLDSKDFENLIELSKGNVFDDEIGWVHLPIKELQRND